MDIADEVRLYNDLTKNVRIAIDETFDNIFICEKNVDDLLKLAPCVFSQKEFFHLLEIRREFYLRVSMFEREATRINSMPLITNTMDVLQIQAEMIRINESFDILSSYVNQFNTRFQSDQFNIDVFILLQKLQDLGFEYDVVDYLELYEYINDSRNMFFIIDFKHPGAADSEGYGYDTNVLSIKPFKTRIDSYKYALEHGISRDSIYTRL